jgi:hypothetical protein
MEQGTWCDGCDCYHPEGKHPKNLCPSCASKDSRIAKLEGENKRLREAVEEREPIELAIREYCLDSEGRIPVPRITDLGGLSRVIVDAIRRRAGKEG